MDKVLDVDGWDLNFWLSDDTGWNAQAYPYDSAGEWIGAHKVWLDLDLSIREGYELKLGDPDNGYTSDDDFWADASWFMASYPHLSPSFMSRVATLPKRVKIVDNKFVEVGE